MDLGSGLFSVDCINLNESDEFRENLEEIIDSWNLCLDKLNGSGDQATDFNREKRSLERIKFFKCFNLNFKISLIENDPIDKTDYKQLLDSVLDKIKDVNYYHSNETDFIQRIHGSTNYILIQTENHLDVLESEHIIKLISSAISCSIVNTKCIYPIFVKIKDLVFELSTGIFLNFGIKINYESALFDLNQFNSSTIADFLKIFENKLKRDLQLDNNVRCFLANTRCLNDYWFKTQSNQQNDLFANLTKNLDKEFKDLKLIDHLENIRFQIKHTEVIPKIEGTQWTFNAEESIVREFQKLENGCFSIQTDHLDESLILKSIFCGQDLCRSLSKDYLTLSRAELKNLDEFQLFCNNNFEVKQNYLTYFLVKSDENNEFIDSNQSSFKSTPYDSIIFRFASFVFNIYSIKKSSNSLKNDQQIDEEVFFEISDYWSALVDQLRRYWELCELIPCVEDRAPDLNCCLLTQKIQMLNCCIKEKQRRENLILNQIRDDREEDEFFDCQTDLNGDDQAEGRSEKLDLTLLNDKNKPIYKPITQELTPYTEDNQDEYLNAYSGANFETDLISDKILDDQKDFDQFLIGKNILLVSDMEAFKSANPECCFEDFIHWYSPKDFIETEYDEQTGQLVKHECLSERFQSPNCLWRKIWNFSKAVPVSKQKRLFNYSMEAERVLDYLNEIKFEELMKHLFSTLVHIGFLKYKQIIDHCVPRSQVLEDCFNQSIGQINYKTRAHQEETNQLLIELEKKVFDHLALVYLLENSLFNQTNEQLNENLLSNRISENLLEQVNHQKLNSDQLKKIVDELANNDLYRISKDKLSSIVFDGLNRMFNFDNLRQLRDRADRKVNANLRCSKEKEFTFVADCNKPAKFSRKLPQKLNFKVFSNDESRRTKVQMNGQFCEDIVYF